MFFLTDEERQLLVKGLLPRTREEPVNPELRGWSWNTPPLAPVFDRRLPLYQVAGRYCDSGRDLYLLHVAAVNPPPTPRMAEGRVLHEVVRTIFTRAKRLIYTLGMERIREFPDQLRVTALPDLSDPALVEKARSLWNFEAHRIIYRVEEILTKQPYIKEDSLAFHAIPVVLEQRLDGGFLGLSPHLSTDALVFAEPMIMEVKFGPPLPFYRLYTTGYALVTEALYGYPVNLGCLVYPRFLADGRIAIERDLHLITDELRAWFIEQRDEMTRLVVEEIDPGLPSRCYEHCRFWSECHPGGETAVETPKRTSRAIERLRSRRSTADSAGSGAGGVGSRGT